MNSLKAAIALFVMILLSCSENENVNDGSSDFVYVERTPITDTVFSVEADVETDAVEASSGSDAADDPAFWLHPDNPSLSIIYGSNKKGGIAAYNLEGEEIAYAEAGRINNVDVAYNLKLKDRVIDVCGGTNRTNNTLDIFEINPETGELMFVLQNQVVSKVNEVYGFCFYHSPHSNKNYAFLCGKDGVIEQYEIIEGNDRLDLSLVNSFDIGTQPEGLAADHKHGRLYIGEENKCIWVVNAEPDDNNPFKLELSSESDNENIDYDIEGLTIYYTSGDHGFLIASSQGNSTFAVYDRFYNKYIGSFEIIDGSIDGNTGTDGIDVINMNLGAEFPTGIFIAQDDRNIDNGKTEPQNFKFVSWEKISNLFEPPLMTDPKFNIRSFFK